jgi:dipeptidyl aminopeptidase/acylaminoacyl peptidase
LAAAGAGIAATPLPSPAAEIELPGRLEEIRLERDGVKLRAFLALPAGAGPENPAPLLLWIHGGPVASWNAWAWRWNPWIMVAAGYAVLLPDPALSTGYGLEFIDRGCDDWGGAPYLDLMAATDKALARADIDQTRTGAMGGSFGGYMANWVAGHTDRFKAIVTHASLWDLESFYGTTDLGYWWEREFTPEGVERNSPSKSVANIKTPMLVIHGDKDYRVPIGEGLRLWADLLSRSGLPAGPDGSSPHRFLYFPTENHWVLTPAHAKVWYGTVLSFLARHVLGMDDAAAPAYPELLG